MRKKISDDKIGLRKKNLVKGKAAEQYQHIEHSKTWAETKLERKGEIKKTGKAIKNLHCVHVTVRKIFLYRLDFE